MYPVRFSDVFDHRPSDRNDGSLSTRSPIIFNSLPDNAFPRMVRYLPQRHCYADPVEYARNFMTNISTQHVSPGVKNFPYVAD